MDHPPVTSRTTRLLAALLVPLIAATVAGAVVLWPRGEGATLRSSNDTVGATVTALPELPCERVAPTTVRCILPEVLLDEGGRVALAEVPAVNVEGLQVGDDVVVERITNESGGARFTLVRVDRSGALLLLLASGLVLLLVFAGWRGLRGVLALAAAALVLLVFLLPALLDGRDPLAVSLVGAAAVAIALGGLGRGFGARSDTALVGTLLGIGAAGLLGRLAVEMTSLGDMASLSPGFVVAPGEVPLAGLLLAGAVFGAVGALSNLSLRVVDATWDLTGTDPSTGWRGVARSGLARARPQLAEMASTLTLAYAGAAVPVLVLLTAGDAPLLDALQDEPVAVHVVQTLVGVTALGASIPFTIALAALVVVRESRAPRRQDPRRHRSRRERSVWGEELD